MEDHSRRDQRRPGESVRPDEGPSDPAGTSPRASNSRSRRESQPAADLLPGKLRISKCRLGLSSVRPPDRVTKLDGVPREGSESSAFGFQGRVVRQREVQKHQQIVSAWWCHASIDEKGLEVFLGRLLAMKADQVMERGFAGRQLSCADQVVFGLPHPLRRLPFHKGASPSPGPRGGTSRRPPSHAGGSWGFRRLNPAGKVPRACS